LSLAQKVQKIATYEKTVFIKKKIIPIKIASFFQIQLKSEKVNREIFYNDSFRPHAASQEIIKTG